MVWRNGWKVRWHVCVIVYRHVDVCLCVYIQCLNNKLNGLTLPLIDQRVTGWLNDGRSYCPTCLLVVRVWVFWVNVNVLMCICVCMFIVKCTYVCMYVWRYVYTQIFMLFVLCSSYFKQTIASCLLLCILD